MKKTTRKEKCELPSVEAYANHYPVQYFDIRVCSNLLQVNSNKINLPENSNIITENTF